MNQNVIIPCTSVLSVVIFIYLWFLCALVFFLKTKDCGLKTAFSRNEPNFQRSKMTVSSYLILTSEFCVLTSAFTPNPIEPNINPISPPSTPISFSPKTLILPPNS